ncbi:MAG: substrate-binding domain-containing protein, partial [Verrucomicrobiota bacterium]
MSKIISSPIPRVALLIETTRSYTRDILSGVRSFLAVHGPWSCFVELRAFDSIPPPWLKTWRGDGILTRTHTQEMADLLAATGIPTVELRSTDILHPFPFIGMDNRLIGRSVADHFLTRGYRHFAAYTIDNESFFRERNENFIEAVSDAGCACPTLATKENTSHLDWETEQSRLEDWLTQLPKPLGLFATSDALGVRVLDACQRA